MIDFEKKAITNVNMNIAGTRKNNTFVFLLRITNTA